MQFSPIGRTFIYVKLCTIEVVQSGRGHQNLRATPLPQIPDTTLLYSTTHSDLQKTKINWGYEIPKIQIIRASTSMPTANNFEEFPQLLLFVELKKFKNNWVQVSN